MECVNANLKQQLSEKDNTELSVKISSEQECTKCKESIDIKQDFKQLHDNYSKLKMFAMKLSEENTKLKEMTPKGNQMSS